MHKSIKNLTVIIVFFSVTLLVGGTVFAQDETEPIIDLRCQREKTLNPEDCYAKDQSCRVYGNSESEINTRRKACGLEDLGQEGFNFFRSDVVLDRGTLPLIVRMVITIAFSILGFVGIGVALWGFLKWMQAYDLVEEQTKAWKWFENGLWGMFWSAGSILLTSGIFYLAGYGFNPYDLDETFDEIFDFCAGIEDQATCEKYDESCKWGGSVCSKQ